MQTADEYLKKLIYKFNPKTITTGFNHTFGAKRQGNSEFLEKRQANYEYFCTPPTIIDNEIVSSTKIKEFISKGNVVDMAVGVIIGSAFGKIVTSLVNDVLTLSKIQSRVDKDNYEEYFVEEEETNTIDDIPVDVFTYDANNSNKIIAYNDEYFKYDNKDNFTVFRNSKLNFSSSNNLVNLDFYKFKYDKQNNRKIKTVGRTKTKYYRKDNKLLKQKNKNTLLFIYKDDKIIGFKFKKKKYFYKKNINEDIIGIYDSNKKLICKYSYDCLGNHKLFVSETNYEIADINPFRFRSYYYDIESGLYHINGKYYDSEINCFLNA